MTHPISHYSFDNTSEALERCREKLFEAISKAPDDERYRLMEATLWATVRDLERRRNDDLAAAIAVRNAGEIDE